MKEYNINEVDYYEDMGNNGNQLDRSIADLDEAIVNEQPANKEKGSSNDAGFPVQTPLRDVYSMKDISNIMKISDMMLNIMRGDLSPKEEAIESAEMNALYMLCTGKMTSDNLGECYSFVKKCPAFSGAVKNHDPGILKTKSVAPERFTLEENEGKNLYLTDSRVEEPLTLMLEKLKKYDSILSAKCNNMDNLDPRHAYYRSCQYLIQMMIRKGMNRDRNSDYEFETLLCNLKYYHDVMNTYVLEGAIETNKKNALGKNIVRIRFNGPKESLDANLNALSETPFGKMARYVRLASNEVKWFARPNTDFTREEVIEALENQKKYAGEVLNLDQKKFMDYKERNLIRGTFEDAISGAYNPQVVLDDATARIELLKAGYPASDVTILSRFYLAMMKEKHANDRLPEESKNPGAEQSFQNNMKLWRALIEDSPLTMKERLRRIKGVMVTLLTGDYSQDMKLIANDFQTCLNKKLYDFEMKAMTATPESLYDALNQKTVDPGHVKSSAQFKKMKQALLELSQVNKEKQPAKYAMLLEDARTATRDYLVYKVDQIKAGRNRSSLEKRRVATASVIFDRLNLEQKSLNYEKEKSRSGKVFAQSLSFEDAKKFCERADELTKGNELIIQELTKLVQLFDYTDNGSDNSTFYNKMIESIQNGIYVLSDPTKKPADVQDAFVNIVKRAEVYKRSKDNTLSKAFDTRTQQRLAVVGKTLQNVQVMANYYYGLRTAFDTVRGTEVTSYSDRSMEDIRKTAEKLQKKYSIPADPSIASIKGKRMSFMMDTDTYKCSRVLTNIVNKVAKECPFMAIYRPKRDPSYYSQKARGMSVSQLAKAVTAYIILNSATLLRNNLSDLTYMENELNNGYLGKSSQTIENDPTFRDIAAKYPNQVFERMIDVKLKALGMRSKSISEIREKYGVVCESRGLEMKKKLVNCVAENVKAGTPKNTWLDMASDVILHSVLACDAVGDEILNACAYKKLDPEKVKPMLKNVIGTHIMKHKMFNSVNSKKDVHDLMKDLIYANKDSYKKMTNAMKNTVNALKVQKVQNLQNVQIKKNAAPVQVTVGGGMAAGF